MASTTTLVLVDGVRIVVPDSLELITPYVLREQMDWFEDEIKFLRRLLRPGQSVIDIGANHGVYTLSMARTVGPTGSVWAFEPASGTAGLLAESIAANGFAHVVLDRCALSRTCGTAQLSLNQNSERNALIHGKPSTDPSETVPVATLDERMERYRWRDIDFLKIDAEGEEAGILQGGERFFADLSPLVQYEVKAGADVHIELVRDFAARGYDSYRLVPGLDLLVPFDTGSTPDGYLLNLFCCKPDRAERLSADGFLLNAAGLPVAGTTRIEAAAGTGEGRRAHDWRNTIGNTPYGTQLTPLWERTLAAGNSIEVDEALSLYSLSRESSRTPTERFDALETSFGLLKMLCERPPSYLRLASLARVARDYGARSIAVDALRQLSQALLQHGRADPDEPFLAPGERFDSVHPGEAIGNWVLAAALEEFERLGAFSSFFARDAARQRLEMVRALGFGGAEMDRRWQLVQARIAAANA